MRIAIIDDEKPARSELEFLIHEKDPQAEITGIASGEEALELLSKEPFDLFLIDINLGDISGTTLAATVRKLVPNAEIVFATAYNTYAEKAFEVGALSYLLKPYSAEKVGQMLDRYAQKKGQSSPEKAMPALAKIPVNMDKKIIMLDLQDIVFIETQNRMCIIHTRTGEYHDNATMNHFEAKLADKGFFRIQKSYLVNLAHVAEIYPWFNNSYCVKMEGYPKEALPVSRKQIKQLKELLSI